MDRSFERLYRRFSTDVYRYAYGVLRNQADAEDVTQTTFMNAFRALERGEEPRAPLNWLITIAHNVCRQRFRTAARRPLEVELNLDVAEALVADEEAPSSHDIERALGHLAFNQRAALVLREVEGRSYAEIAAVLGLTTSAVETLIFRARRALREQLEGALTCDQAELAISKQLDKQLTRGERSQLRAHLRECPDCASVARRQRAHRSALKALGSIPLPPALAGLFGSGGATVGIGIVAKATAVVAAGSLVGLGSWDLRHTVIHVPKAPRKISAAPASHTSGRALVPILRGHAARGPRGIPFRSDRVVSTGTREATHGHRQQAERGRRLDRPEARKARGPEEGARGRPHRAHGRRVGGSARGRRGHAPVLPQEARQHKR
ncbi:MAG TPA: sigma-70 family RNA polymerase sigma factor [Gaiellaceae bacterium]|nr:sigma-70 family RNA polymerase sigma factor [Gaiellaceae bacterium]